jgi:hypothetical protein
MYDLLTCVHNRGTFCSFGFKAATRDLRWNFELGFDGVFEDGDLSSSCFRSVQ